MSTVLICFTMSTLLTTSRKSACGIYCGSRCEGYDTTGFEGIFWSCFHLASTWRVFGVPVFWLLALGSKHWGFCYKPKVTLVVM
jgi:hypothetical protein